MARNAAVQAALANIKAGRNKPQDPSAWAGVGRGVFAGLNQALQDLNAGRGEKADREWKEKERALRFEAATKGLKWDEARHKRGVAEAVEEDKDRELRRNAHDLSMEMNRVQLGVAEEGQFQGHLSAMDELFGDLDPSHAASAGVMGAPGFDEQLDRAAAGVGAAKGAYEYMLEGQRGEMPAAFYEGTPGEYEPFNSSKIDRDIDTLRAQAMDRMPADVKADDGLKARYISHIDLLSDQKRQHHYTQFFTAFSTDVTRDKETKLDAELTLERDRARRVAVSTQMTNGVGFVANGNVDKDSAIAGFAQFPGVSEDDVALFTSMLDATEAREGAQVAIDSALYMFEAKNYRAGLDIVAKALEMGDDLTPGEKSRLTNLRTLADLQGPPEMIAQVDAALFDKYPDIIETETQLTALRTDWHTLQQTPQYIQWSAIYPQLAGIVELELTERETTFRAGIVSQESNRSYEEARRLFTAGEAEGDVGATRAALSMLEAQAPFNASAAQAVGGFRARHEAQVDRRGRQTAVEFATENIALYRKVEATYSQAGIVAMIPQIEQDLELLRRAFGSGDANEKDYKELAFILKNLKDRAKRDDGRHASDFEPDSIEAQRLKTLMQQHPEQFNTLLNNSVKAHSASFSDTFAGSVAPDSPGMSFRVPDAKGTSVEDADRVLSLAQEHLMVMSKNWVSDIPIDDLMDEFALITSWHADVMRANGQPSYNRAHPVDQFLSTFPGWGLNDISEFRRHKATAAMQREADSPQVQRQSPGMQTYDVPYASSSQLRENNAPLWKERQKLMRAIFAPSGTGGGISIRGAGAGSSKLVSDRQRRFEADPLHEMDNFLRAQNLSPQEISIIMASVFEDPRNGEAMLTAVKQAYMRDVEFMSEEESLAELTRIQNVTNWDVSTSDGQKRQDVFDTAVAKAHAERVAQIAIDTTHKLEPKMTLFEEEFKNELFAHDLGRKGTPKRTKAVTKALDAAFATAGLSEDEIKRKKAGMLRKKLKELK